MSGLASDGSPSSAEVERIATLPRPDVRNLHITQCYHDLSLVMARRTGPSANWCTFATWASKQAGQSIRKEDLARAVERTLTTAPSTAQAATAVVALAQRLGARTGTVATYRAVWDALDPEAAVERTSAAVARGNVKVFAEIGHAFARFTAGCLDDPTFDADTITRFCATLRPGDPPDGQRYLRQAFTRYYRAFFEPDPKARAELILLANLEIGVHEQTRLQPEIAEALDAPLLDPRHVVRRLLRTLFPYRGWPTYALVLAKRLFKGPTPVDAAVEHLVAVARQHLRLVLTEHLMTLDFPHGERLRLGQDLRAAFPPILQQVASPDLRSLLAQVDPTPDSLRDTATTDWADLADRLHFIADLFRCYQETEALSEPPFRPDQVAMFRNNRLPPGPL